MSSNRFYFLNKETNHRDSEVESAPQGTTKEEFAPRVLAPSQPSPYMKSRKIVSKASSRSVTGNSTRSVQNGNNGGFFSWFKPQTQSRPYGQVGTLVKLRKAPIKIEPKVFFANERTFLAWMHLSVILAGASIAILAFADDSSAGQLYGIALLPVAIAFIVYSIVQYQRRARMIRHRHPGPYEDTTGPIVLGVMLMLAIVGQFGLKMYSMAE